LAARDARDLWFRTVRGSARNLLEGRHVAWLTATYLIESEPEHIEARAKALALEQSVECPLEAIGDQRVLDEIVARVGRIEPVSDGRYRVDVRIATQTIGGNTAQLINMIFGNCSLWGNVEFVDFDFP
jgi:ribulose-bisphosphate carboxylase large chain